MKTVESPNVAGVVLAYHPDSVAIDNIMRLRTYVPRVYVVNNSPDAATAVMLETLAGDAGIVVLDQPGNVGVAAGFNAGIRVAIERGADFVWIFDQDSAVTDGALESMLRTYQREGAATGIIAPALRSYATGIIYPRESGVGSREVDVVISSGSLFSRKLLETIGLHDEPLFIDYVDHEISLRARKHGFKNYKDFDAILDHRFGDSDPVPFLGRRIYLANYSPFRQFHAARNRIVVIRRYGFGRWFWDDLFFTAKAWTKVLLCERDRPRKIVAALRGVAAGLRYPARQGKW